MKEQKKLLTMRRPLARRIVKAPGVCVYTDGRARESPGAWTTDEAWALEEGAK